MWICPLCNAINFERGKCECCGYTYVSGNITIPFMSNTFPINVNMVK